MIIIAVLASLFINSIVETLLFTIYSYFLNLNFDFIMNYYLHFSLIKITIILFIILYFKKINFNIKKFFYKQDIYTDLNNEENKKINAIFIFLTILVLIQNIYILFNGYLYMIYCCYNNKNNDSVYVLIFSIFFILATIQVSKKLYETINVQKNNFKKRIKEKIKVNFELELRRHFHDINHHLGTIAAMMELNKIKEAKDYLNEITGEIDFLQESIKSGNDYLNSLLFYKKNKCTKNNIYLDIKIIKKINSNIPDWELNRLVGNLIENAIEALLEKNLKNKKIELIIDQDNNNNIISVKTIGVYISQKINDKIFRKGYSEKGNDRGLGLDICKCIANKYKGSIILKVDKKGSIFIVKLPIKKNNHINLINYPITITNTSTLLNIF
ncbi:MAG: sensor histidine kinase [archaeon]